MRITAANIPASTARTNTSPAVDKTTPRHQSTGAGDSYSKNLSQSQIIDAEYVEFYTPSIDVLNKERQILDSTLEPDSNGLELSGTGPVTESPEVGKYQLKAHEAPPPGSYIDTFA